MAANATYPEPAQAWARHQPDPGQPWDLKWAGHLYRRAAFGATWAQLQQVQKAGLQTAVDRLLQPAGELDAFNRQFDAIQERGGPSANPAEARAWWLRRMIETPHPLLERMTLFWHDYFGVGLERAPGVRLMNRHVQRLRKHAQGNFADLLKDAVDSPALLVALDAKAGRKSRPPLLLAQTVLEQYTVGTVNFAETDVRELARAFAGRFVLQDELRLIESECDPGTKTILGRTGAFDAKDALGVLAKHPATAENVVRKLYRFLISETDAPPPEFIRPLATDFARDLRIAPLVETMLRSNCFFSAAAYRQKIKSPVEYALGIIRPMEAIVPTLQLDAALADLGQDLYDPPTRKGWAGHRCWLNRYTLAGRSRLAQSLFAAAGPLGGKLDPQSVARSNGHRMPSATEEFLAGLYLQNDVSDASRTALKQLGSSKPAESLRELAALTVSLPEFHLS